MEFNKIFAALLVAGIIASFSGFLAKTLTHPHELKKNAFSVEVAEDSAGGAKKVKKAQPVLAMIAGADLERGKKLSKACAACHTFNKGGANGVGPNQYGVVGRSKEAVSGFAYSGTLASQGGNTWTYAELNKFLWKPKAYAKGTKMNYIGLKKAEDRAAMIAWMRTLADKPIPLPGASEIAAEEAELSQ